MLHSETTSFDVIVVCNYEPSWRPTQRNFALVFRLNIDLSLKNSSRMHELHNSHAKISCKVVN